MTTDTKALEILSDYKKRTAKMEELKTAHKDIQPLTTPDVMYIAAMLHPTARKESKEVTRKLINFLCDNAICTAQDIYDGLGYADKPVLTRLRKLMGFGLVRRESKKYYMPTPRMKALRAKYMERLCGE
jgi:hypothetical protein